MIPQMLSDLGKETASARVAPPVFIQQILPFLKNKII
jgi:hypothetical protein